MDEDTSLLQYTVIGPYECASEPCGEPNSPGSGFGPYHWDPVLEKDYGTPIGEAEQVSNGVWRREWSKASFELDCNHWTGKILEK